MTIEIKNTKRFRAGSRPVPSTAKPMFILNESEHASSIRLFLKDVPPGAYQARLLYEAYGAFVTKANLLLPCETVFFYILRTQHATRVKKFQKRFGIVYEIS